MLNQRAAALLVLAPIFMLIPALASSSCDKPTPTPFDDSTYYVSTEGVAREELKAELNSIIGSHTVYSYTPCVWEIVKEADEDPDNSENVIGIYTRRSIPKADQDTGTSDGDAWNREHIWSNSHGFPNQSQDAYTDAHHLRACDKSVNTDRSDHDFAYGGVADDECVGCKEGSGTWEAPDEVKGDVARMMFYMATRYEGNDSSDTPDIELVDELTDSGEALFGDLCDLVDWHLKDPVSSGEVTRNDVIYSWQGNRNPYIDHPEFVVSIWGEACGIEQPGPDQEPIQPDSVLPSILFLLLAE